MDDMPFQPHLDIREINAEPMQTGLWAGGSDCMGLEGNPLKEVVSVFIWKRRTQCGQDQNDNP